MLYVQVTPETHEISLLESDAAYPGGGWDIVRPLMEAEGWRFLETDGDITGKRYDPATNNLVDVPLPVPPLPTETELLRADIADLKKKQETQTALLMQIGMGVVSAPDTLPTPPTELPENPDMTAQPSGELPDMTGLPPIPDADTLKNLIGGLTP